MFGLFKKKPKNALEQLIFTIYGNPPPPKRANVGEAVALAAELLDETVDDAEIGKQAIALNDGPIPYSTHDLALSIAMHFFKQPGLAPHMFNAQLMTRMRMVEWLQQGLVAPLLHQSFEGVLYERYKPGR